MNPLEKPRRLWDGLFFLGLFLLMYCFYRYAHPLVLVSLTLEPGPLRPRPAAPPLPRF